GACHTLQQCAIDAEVVGLTPLVIDDTVALAGHRNQTRPQAVLWALQGPQQVPGDGVHQTWTLCSTHTHTHTHTQLHFFYLAQCHRPVFLSWHINIVRLFLFH